MIYDLSKDIDIKSFLLKTEMFMEKGFVVELVKKTKKEEKDSDTEKQRTGKQNKYVHVLFNLFGIEYGYRLEEAKILIKRECPFMRYTKSDNVFLKSTADLDTKGMTDFIEWFRNFAGENGLYLPTSREYYDNSTSIDKEINKFKPHL